MRQLVLAVMVMMALAGCRTIEGIGKSMTEAKATMVSLVSLGSSIALISADAVYDVGDAVTVAGEKIDELPGL